jgi:hypothetical protein
LGDLGLVMTRNPMMFEWGPKQLKLNPGTLFSSADRRRKAMIMSGQRYHFPLHDTIQFQGASAFKESSLAYAGRLGYSTSSLSSFCLASHVFQVKDTWDSKVAGADSLKKKQQLKATVAHVNDRRDE